MPPFTIFRRLQAALVLVAAASAGTALALDKVTFGSNWVAEAEHALTLDRADDLALAALDDGELLVARGAQAGLSGWGVGV